MKFFFYFFISNNTLMAIDFRKSIEKILQKYKALKTWAQKPVKLESHCSSLLGGAFTWRHGGNVQIIFSALLTVDTSLFDLRSYHSLAAQTLARESLGCETKAIMVKHCVAAGCSNTYSDNVSLFKFPQGPYFTTEVGEECTEDQSTMEWPQSAQRFVQPALR